MEGIDEGFCHLQRALGRLEPCPEDPCPFWQDERCVIAGLRVDLGGNPDLAELLLRIRTEISGSPTGYGLVPPGLRI